MGNRHGRGQGTEKHEGKILSLTDRKFKHPRNIRTEMPSAGVVYERSQAWTKKRIILPLLLLKVMV